MRCVIAVGLAVAAMLAGMAGCGSEPEGGPPQEPSAVAPAAAPSPSAAAPVPEAPAVGENPPRIEVATRKYDMGVIPAEGLTKGSVVIYNRGGEPLTITQVGTSCGCTTGSVENKVIPPGGETPMTVVVNPGKIHGFESTKTLSIYSNDPENPRITVDVTAKVEPEFLVEPSQLDFGQIPKGETVTRQIAFRQAAELPVVLNGVKAWGSPPGLGVAFVKTPESEWSDPGRAEYTIDVTIDTNDVPPGPYKAMIGLDTSLKRVPRYNYTVTANVTAPYAVKPRPLSLGLVNPGKAPAGTIVVSSDQPVSVSDVAVTGGDLSATPRTADDGRSVAIDVAVSPEASTGSKREQVSFTVKVGEATFQERVPVSGVVAHRPGAQAASPAP